MQPKSKKALLDSCLLGGGGLQGNLGFPQLSSEGCASTIAGHAVISSHSSLPVLGLKTPLAGKPTERYRCWGTLLLAGEAALPNSQHCICSWGWERGIPTATARCQQLWT